MSCNTSDIFPQVKFKVIRKLVQIHKVYVKTKFFELLIDTVLHILDTGNSPSGLINNQFLVFTL